MLRCNQRIKFSGKKFGKKRRMGKRGEREGEERKKGKGCFFGGVMKGKGAGFELVKEFGMEGKR